MLIVGQDLPLARGMMMTTLLSLLGRYAPDGRGAERATFHVLDFSLPDGEEENIRLPEIAGYDIRYGARRQLAETVVQLAAEVDRRMDDDGAQHTPVYLVLHGLHRARDLRPQDGGGFAYAPPSADAPPDPAKLFRRILKEGPEVRVHTIAWCDLLSNAQRVLDRDSLNEFAVRVAMQMSVEDSRTLIHSEAASLLGPNRAFYLNEDESRLEKFRPYRSPDPEWLAKVCGQLSARAAGGGASASAAS
jgi:hypothetical protein